MSHAIAQTRSFADSSFEALRFALVTSCGLALIAAGQTLPI